MASFRRSVALLVAATALVACAGSDDAVPTDSTPATAAASDDGLLTGDATTDESAVSSPAPGAEPSPDDAAQVSIADSNRFPDVIDARAEQNGDTWRFSATLSSPYDTPERYADAWRIVAPDGTVLGERILTHDHAAEQPFTRSLDGVEIPTDVDVVTIEGRDLEFGYGGETVELTLQR